LRSQQLDWDAVVARGGGGGGGGGGDGDGALPADGRARASNARSDVADSNAKDSNVKLLAAPLGRLSELIGQSSGSILGYFEARVALRLLPLELLIATAILYLLVGSVNGAVSMRSCMFSCIFRLDFVVCCTRSCFHRRCNSVCGGVLQHPACACV
jgi:hypothetical protein